MAGSRLLDTPTVVQVDTNATGDRGTGTMLIMAGGTGGHIFPGLAVAQVLRERGWRVHWLGQPSSMEARLVPARDIDFHGIEFGAFRGKGLARKLALPRNLWRGVRQALGVIDRVKPDVVLGMGGYVTVPGGLAARLRGRPIVLHEQNAVAGMANRLLARLARRVLVAFQGAMAGAEWTGNPVNEQIALITAPAMRYSIRQGPLHILIVGGSLGAKALNEVVPNAMGLLAPEIRPVVTHQSGERHLEALRAAYRDAGVPVEAVAFIDDMAAAYAEADLVIARAGAMTVAEVACAGVASILVPYPHAVDDHQSINAEHLARAGAAIVMKQDGLTSSGLATLIAQFDRKTLARMAMAARGLGKPEAAVDVADICEEVAGMPHPPRGPDDQQPKAEVA